MASILQRNRPLTFGLIAAALVVVGVGADGPTESITVEGLTFDAPSAWKTAKPRSAMIQKQLTIAPTEGDKTPAELTISAIGGGGGGVEANIKRWQSQFKDEDGKEAKIEQKTVKGKNVDIIRAETAGHYFPPPFTRLPDQPNFRLVGAIVQAGGTGYYLKLIGPDKTVKANTEAFDKLLASVKSAAN